VRELVLRHPELVDLRKVDKFWFIDLLAGNWERADDSRKLAGVSSCKELKGAKIDLVIRHLEGRIGYRRSQVQFGKERTERNNEGKPNWATERQVRKIREMWRQVSREKTEAALRVWLRRRFKVGAVEWLTVGQAAGVIEGLKAMGKCID